MQRHQTGGGCQVGDDRSYDGSQIAPRGSRIGRGDRSRASAQHGLDEQVLPGHPPPVDRRLVDARAPRHPGNCRGGDAVFGQFVERRGQHGLTDMLSTAVRYIGA